LNADEFAHLGNQLLELGKVLPAFMTPDQRADMLLVKPQCWISMIFSSWLTD
jgi:hypothetical protein